jgi:uncharacterized membrane protein
MRELYLVSVWLHILAAITWIGGMMFIGLVLVPILRKPPLRDSSALLLYRTGLRFRQVGWISLLLLVLTGMVNLGVRGYGWADLWDGSLWQGGWGHALGAKLLLVALVLLLSAVHDFYVGPRAVAHMERDPDADQSLRLRRMASWMGRLSLLLSLAILALAVTLPRGGL